MVNTTSIQSPKLQRLQKYYWRVDAERSDGLVVSGDLWAFSPGKMIVWCKFDGDAKDSSGYGHDGTENGSVTYTPGKSGQALVLRGEGDHVLIPDIGGYLNGLNAMTVCLWVKSDEIPTDRGFVIFEDPASVRHPRGGDDNRSMRYDAQGSLGGGTNVIKCGITSNATSGNVPGRQQLESSSNAQTSQWQHLSMTWSSGDLLKLYINGVEDTQIWNEPAKVGTLTGYTKLIVGKGGKDLGTGRSWKGLIDDVRIYNYALDEAQIKTIFSGKADVRAHAPDPYDGKTLAKTVAAKSVDPSLTLSWVPGIHAKLHQVYFGTDADAVRNATKGSSEYKGSKALGEKVYEPGKLNWATTYYWRVDEVNSINPDSPWTGSIWSFTTADFVVVDDFEQYSTDDKIRETWLDGSGYGTPGTVKHFAGNGTGSAVGNERNASYTEERFFHGGRQSMSFSYDNNKQDFAKYSESERTLIAPRDWTQEGVKELSLWFRGRLQAFAEKPAGSYTMIASGSDIFNRTDEFHYAWKQLTGPGSIEARVVSIQNTHPWAKAGLMIRETLEPNSKFAAVYVTPARGDGTAEQGCRFQIRTTTNGLATSDTSVATREQMTFTAPYWVKLERTTTVQFNAYYSSDPATDPWHLMAWSPQHIEMTANVYIGLALTSHNSDAICKAVFSDVRTTGTIDPTTWGQRAIGAAMISNDAEPLYIAVSDCTGTSGVIYHDDPGVTQIDTWTEWIIPLQAFADQGVNLIDVDKLAIGVGIRGNSTTPSGSGRMYFDDIRLYRRRSATNE